MFDFLKLLSRGNTLRQLTVFGAFLSMLAWGGVRSSFAVFLSSMSSDFPGRLAELAGVQSLSLALYGLLSPCVGWLLKRHPEYDRTLCLVGLTLTAMGLGCCFFIRTVWMFYVFYGVLTGFGLAIASPTTFNSILARRIRSQNGFAIGLASSGMGIGTLAIIPLVTHLASTINWHTAFVFLSLIIGFVIPFLWFTIPPLQNNNLSMNNSLSRSRLSLSLSLQLSLIVFSPFIFFSIQLVLTHFIYVMQSSHIPRTTAAFLISTAGMINATCRPVFGLLLDRYSLSKTALCQYVALLTMLGSGICASAGGPMVCGVLTAVGLGLAWAIAIPFTIIVITKVVGITYFSFYYGIVEALIGFMGAVGAWVGATSYDIFNSYIPAFLIALFLGCLSIISIYYVLRCQKI